MGFPFTNVRLPLQTSVSTSVIPALGIYSGSEYIWGSGKRVITDHNVDGTIALESELEERNLVIPVDHVAFDGCGLSMGKRGSSQFPTAPCMRR